MVAIYETESSLPLQIKELLAQSRRAANNWMNDIEDEVMAAQHEEMTIYGPFGGDARRARDQLADFQARTRSQFKSGTAEIEFVQAIDTDDLVVLVVRQTADVTFAGRDASHPWNLRVTEVYTKEADGLHRLHRHADPLVKLRNLDETLLLLQEQPSTTAA